MKLKEPGRQKADFLTVREAHKAVKKKKLDEPDRQEADFLAMGKALFSPTPGLH